MCFLMGAQTEKTWKYVLKSFQTNDFRPRSFVKLLELMISWHGSLVRLIHHVIRCELLLSVSRVLRTLSTVQSVCGSPMRNLALPFLLVTVITCYTLIQNINQSSQIAVSTNGEWIMTSKEDLTNKYQYYISNSWFPSEGNMRNIK